MWRNCLISSTEPKRSRLELQHSSGSPPVSAVPSSPGEGTTGRPSPRSESFSHSPHPSDSEAALTATAQQINSDHNENDTQSSPIPTSSLSPNEIGSSLHCQPNVEIGEQHFPVKAENKEECDSGLSCGADNNHDKERYDFLLHVFSTAAGHVKCWKFELVGLQFAGHSVHNAETMLTCFFSGWNWKRY